MPLACQVSIVAGADKFTSAMRVIITGGCGFIGQMLGRDILRRGRLLAHARGGGEALAPVRELVLADVARPPSGLLFPELEAAPARVALGDVGDAAFCRSLFAGLHADEPGVAVPSRQRSCRATASATSTS